MCTVIVSVPSPSDASGEVRLLAVRDEDPGRPWNPLGEWWPQDHPGVIGVRDVRAGGAWMAAAPALGRVAVLLNRLDLSSRRDDEVVSRGAVALDSVAGRSPGAAGPDPVTRGFNLVEVDGTTVRVVSWDGLTARRRDLAPGVHMVAHDDVDDPGTPRISRWLDEFRAALEQAGVDWEHAWMDVLGRSSSLPGDDDEAIIRDQVFEGFPSSSLLIASAAVSPGHADVRYAALPEAGHWSAVELGPAQA